MLLQLAGTIRHTFRVLPTVILAVSRHTFSSETAAAAAAASHYEVLGVDRTAAPADIKKAFRLRAKALHPDLNSQLSQSDAEAFLRLVAAYEVLSDAEQRRLYDAATDPQLPHMLRRAAAAQQQQQADAAAGQATGTAYETDASFNWRWGLADWARCGPSNASDVPVSADVGATAGGALDLRLSVLTALRRHQRDLEVELHSALMTAFLGPRLELRAGELPSSLELDERSNPTLTDDLLHLVHGRTLLGVVQLPRMLQLEGADESLLQLPSSSSRVLQPFLHLPAASAANTSSSNADVHPADVQQLHQTVDPAADAAGQQHEQDQQPAQQLLQQQRHHPVDSQQQHWQQHWQQQAQSGVHQQAVWVDSCSAAQQHSASRKAEPAQAPLGLQAAADATDATCADEAASATTRQAGSAETTACTGAAAAAADPDDEIGDAEWRQLLQQQHPLLGSYDWRAVPAAAAAAASTDAAGAGEQQQGDGDPVIASTQADHLPHGEAGAVAETLSSSDHTGDDHQHQQQQDGEQQGTDHQHIEAQQDVEAAAAVAEAGFGGKAAREAWEQRVEGLAHAVESVGDLRPPVDMPRLSEADLAFIADYERRVQTDKLPAFSWWGVGGSAADTESAQQQQQQWQGERGEGGWPKEVSWQQQWHQLDAAGQVQMQQEWHRQWQQQQKQRQQAKHEWQDMQQQMKDAHQHRDADEQQQRQTMFEQLQHQHSRQHEHEQQQQQAAPRRPRSGHRRLWRWLRTPSPDWLAADWSFTDGSEGVVVLRLLQEGSVAAVAVRDDTQDNKPIKVYVDGVLYAAVLEDVVMQPLTGKLMAVLYRFYTPGVHHLYCYLPNTPAGASRVLAKMLRRWMPPSSTWLFPPRADSHDRCSWLMEWEGFGTQHRPGWMHPAVYVLTAAYYTYDIEARSLSRKLGPCQQRFQQLSGHAKVAVVQAWAACRQLMQRLQLVVSR